MPAEQPALCWKQRALPFGFALSTKKLPIDTTTIVSIANRPNLYLFYLRAIVTKPNTTWVEGNLQCEATDQSWYVRILEKRKLVSPRMSRPGIVNLVTLVTARSDVKNYKSVKIPWHIPHKGVGDASKADTRWRSKTVWVCHFRGQESSPDCHHHAELLVQ